MRDRGVHHALQSPVNSVQSSALQKGRHRRSYSRLQRADGLWGAVREERMSARFTKIAPVLNAPRRYALEPIPWRPSTAECQIVPVGVRKAASAAQLRTMLFESFNVPCA